MNRDRNYLYKAVRGNEDSITELLVNLQRPRLLREITLRTLGVDDQITKRIQFKNFRTQKSITNTGRPDIVIEVEEEPTVRILVEVKTELATELQETQTNEYIQYLNESSSTYKQLIFLAPKDYPWTEAHNTAIKRNAQGLNVSKVTWEDLIAAIRETEIMEDAPVYNEILEFISKKIIGVLDSITLTLKEAAAMFSTEDFQNVNRARLKLRELFKKSSKEIDNKLEGLTYYETTDSIDEIDDENGVGFYLDKGHIYIGASYF
jgi:hypothetical protein